MKDDNWDKILLIAVSVIVLGFSGLFVFKALGFSEKFVMEPATPNDELPETDEGRANLARQFVESTQEWKTPVKGAAPKPTPLFVSIPIVESNGVLIDMLDPSAPLIRPPVPNSWLLANNLDFLNSGVMSQDPDGDGFRNQAEFDAKTDPNDPDSHPPYADKIVMLSRQQQGYMLRFSAKPDAERFQIQRLPTRRWPERENFYLRIGETSEDGQFRVESYEEKRAQNAQGISVDASVVTITYLPKDETHKLIRNIDTDIPTYYAELEFQLEPGKNFYVKEGDPFPGDTMLSTVDPETRYRVTKVNEDSTTITYQTGSEPEQTVEIKKK